jgi:hypothetical protein
MFAAAMGGAFSPRNAQPQSVKMEPSSDVGFDFDPAGNDTTGGMKMLRGGTGAPKVVRVRFLLISLQVSLQVSC